MILLHWTLLCFKHTVALTMNVWTWLWICSLSCICWLNESVHSLGASYRDYGDLRILGVITAMAAAVLVIVCVVHRRRRWSRQQRKSVELRRLSADALAPGADAAVDGGPDCVADGSIEVRYVGRSANCTSAHATGNSVTSPRSAGMTSSTARAGGGKRLLKEKTEKVSIVWRRIWCFTWWRHGVRCRDWEIELVFATTVVSRPLTSIIWYRRKNRKVVAVNGRGMVSVDDTGRRADSRLLDDETQLRAAPASRRTLRGQCWLVLPYILHFFVSEIYFTTDQY